MQSKQRTIGLLGGMSWESTALYYRQLNVLTNERLGGHHNARSLIYSFDYDELLSWAEEGRWDKLADALSAEARRIEDGGASFVMLTANTAHAVADSVEAAISVPFLHIVDPTAKAIRAAGLKRVALLGTKFTMEMDFLVGRFRNEYDLDVVVPASGDRELLHRIIVEELTLGEIREPSKHAVLEIADRLVAVGVEGIVVACTELPLLLRVDEFPVPAFDATELHVRAAVDLSLADVS